MPGDADRHLIVRTHQSGGVWHVTRDGEFFGDYLSEAVAHIAAKDAALDIRRAGGEAELVCDIPVGPQKAS